MDEAALCVLFCSVYEFHDLVQLLHVVLPQKLVGFALGVLEFIVLYEIRGFEVVFDF